MKTRSRILALFAALFLVIVPFASVAQSMVDGLEVNLTRADYDAILEDVALLYKIRQALGDCTTVEQIKQVQNTYDTKYGDGFVKAAFKHPFHISSDVAYNAFRKVKVEYYNRLKAATDLESQLALRNLLSADEFEQFYGKLTDAERFSVNQPVYQALTNELSACTTVEAIKTVQQKYDAQFGDGFTAAAFDAVATLAGTVAPAFRAASEAYFAALAQSQTVEAHEALKAQLTETEYEQFTSLLTLQQQSALAAVPELIAARSCTCGLGADLDSPHETDCAMWKKFMAVSEMENEEIAVRWLAMTETERAFVLHQVSASEAKGVDLRLLLGIYTRKELTVENGPAMSIVGALPENVKVSAEKLETQLTEYGQQLFAIDVSLTTEDGQKYTLAEGEKLIVTLDAAQIPLADGQLLKMYHETDEETEFLQVAAVNNGQLTFETTGFSVVYGVDTQNAAAWEKGDTIYLDLFYGNIVINDGGFSVKNGDNELAHGSLDETHTQYYIYQSKGESQAAADGGYVLPDYDPVEVDGEEWRKYFYGKTNVQSVSEMWNEVAREAGRESVPYRVDISGSSNFTVTVHDIWTTHTDGNQSYTITRGGIGYNPTGGSLTLQLKGDNRVGALHYVGTNTQLTIKAHKDDPNASLTAATYTPGDNYWNTAIGGVNTRIRVEGIVIESGYIYAGTTTEDLCSAIGGGGNSFGQVTIKGGEVTAVCHSTGAAIGGGIGYYSIGGDAEVNISGGKVFAYNGSYYGEGYPVPAAAIGGGSSYHSHGNENTTVNITGGTVDATSVYGVAIGGGGSSSDKGGPAVVRISGNATVTAKSIKGTLGGNPVEAGASIGGGTGGMGGGDAEVYISAGTMAGYPKITTGSIGGGKVTNDQYKIGSAKVEIHGGTIHGQVVMAAGAQKACSFLMTDGVIDNNNNAAVYWPGNKNTSNTYAFIEGNGGAVYVENGTATMEGGTIRNCRDLQRVSGKGCGGGAICVRGANAAFVMTGGTIENCDGYNGGGVLAYQGTVTIDGTGKNTDQLPTIQNCKGADGGGVMAWTARSSISIKHAKILNNNASHGGGVEAYDGGKITLGEGTLIQGNKATYDYGGGVRATGTSSVVTVDGAEIRGNTAQKEGGGVHIASGTYTMTSGTIENNTATNSGGGVYVGSGTVVIENGTVKTNHATNGNGGGFYVGGGSLTMKNGTVEGNTATNGNGGAAYVTNTDVTFGVAATDDAPASAISVLQNSAKNGGGFYLDGASAAATINGGEIKENTATANGGGIYNQGTITVEGGKVTGNQATQNGGGMYIDNGTIMVNGGEITSNTATQNGGGVYLNGTSASATVSGGEITSNKAMQNGGGLYVAGGIVRVNDGTIQANEAVNGAGLVVDGSNASAAAAIQGGTINRNIASANGGGVYTTGAQAECTITNGVIGSDVERTEENQTASGAADANKAQTGAGLYIGGGRFTLNGGTIGWNEASSSGGGLVVASDDIAANANIMNGSIRNNKAASCGGGIYMNGVKATASISNNVQINANSAANGGGVYLRGGSELTVSGGFITGNTAVGNSTLTNATAYQQDALAGVGGGVSVAAGTSEKPTKFTLNGSGVGLYGNLADAAADDVFASGSYTLLNLPAKSDMILSGEFTQADGWFEDYVVKDRGYTIGWGGTENMQPENIVRYRTAKDGVGIQAYEAEVTDINKPDKYVCVTLGVSRAGVTDLTIIKKIESDEGTNNTDRPVFVFTVSGTKEGSEETVTFIVPIHGEGEVLIPKVPNGTYTITENTEWAWRYACDEPVQEVRLDVNTVNTGKTVTFTNTLQKTTWLDDNAVVDNKYEFSTGTGGTGE